VAAIGAQTHGQCTDFIPMIKKALGQSFVFESIVYLSKDTY